jgi:hypothetical protein
MERFLTLAKVWQVPDEPFRQKFQWLQVFCQKWYLRKAGLWPRSRQSLSQRISMERFLTLAKVWQYPDEPFRQKFQWPQVFCQKWSLRKARLRPPSAASL